MATNEKAVAMKIEFLTQDDPLYILPFFEEFFRYYGEEFKILQISLSRAMGKRPRLQLMRELFNLYGVSGSVRIAGRLLRARLLDRIPRRRGAGRYDTLYQLCRSYGLPCARIGSPNAPEFIEGARLRCADVIVSVACPYILKEALIELPLRGCVNIHHAPLPRYKGMMPTFWQMYNAEGRVGVTVHYMVPKVDQGAALLQEFLPIESGESLDQLIRRSKRHGAHCMARVLRQIAQGTQQVLLPSAEDGSYFTFPTLEQIRAFRRRGLCAI
jgi:methionyl-tRNA formyltransferase